MPRTAGLALAVVLAAGPAGAQVRASLDAGASHVEYNGFLPSAAFSLTPSLTIVSERLAFATRGTWLQFESGNNSVQGLVAGSLILPASPGVTAELGTELGGSRYEGFARFSHVLGRARLQFRRGWVATTVGAAAFDGDPVSVMSLGAALRLEERDRMFTLAGTATLLGGTSYADVEAIIRHARPGGFQAEAVVSARAGDPDGDPGPYVEASLAIPLTGYAAVVLAGGRYATDAVRGNVAGRYVTAAFRFTAPRRIPRPITLALPANLPAANGATVAATLVEIRRGRGETCTLMFRAAIVPEVMADFTDWLPIALQPAGPELWSVTLPMAPGRHRLNVRLGGGPWGVPSGTTPLADDFLGVVGTVVIP